MNAKHTIHSHRHHFGWDNALDPVLHVEPGAEIEFEVVDASGGQLTRDATAADVAALDFEHVNPVTGPVFVEGAEPGDTLVIEVLGFEQSGWGWTAIIPGFGLLADDFQEPWLRISEYDTRRVEFAPHVHLPVRPFPGTIGVAPAEPGLHSVVPPRRVGGNLDIRDLVAGAKLYLPVAVAGALFSVGDTHAAQGDGEVCGTAIESPMRIGLKFDLVRGGDLPAPQFETPGPLRGEEARGGYHATTGVGPDLYGAAQDAIRAMIDHLGRAYDCDPEFAYALCSVAVDLKISEVVDAPNWVVAAYLPKGIFR